MTSELIVPGQQTSSQVLASWPARAAGPALLAAVVFLVSLGVRLWGLDLALTTDEGYWMQRSVRFAVALERGEFAATYRTGHPGVSVMWTAVMGIGQDGLAPLRSGRLAQTEQLELAPSYSAALSDARRAIAVVAAALVATAVLLSWRLFGFGAALTGGAVLTLDPFAIGMTRLLHVDALLAPLMLVSVLAGLVFWTVSRHWAYLALSAGAGGLALLTKAPAGVLPIFFGAVCLAALVDWWQAGHRGLAGLLWTVLPLIAWGVAAVAVYVLLFPAVWLDPIGRAGMLIEFVRKIGLEPHNGNFFLGQPVMTDPGLAYYLVAIPLRMSPLVALGLGLLILEAPRSDNRPAIHWLLGYVVLFVVLMSLASKKFDRYMLPALMTLDLLAGVGLWRLAQLAITRGDSSSPAGREELTRPARPGDLTPPAPLRGANIGFADIISGAERGESGWRTAGLAVGLASVLVAGQLALLVPVWPYPIAYYNPLSGGAARARDLIMVGWGEGLEQVAHFLNTRPEADQLLVATSYNHVVRPRFSGTTIPITMYMRGAAGLPTPDYVVLYINAVQRQQWSPVLALAQSLGEPVFVARVNGLEYAWVYALPRAGPRSAAPVPIQEDTEGEEN